MRGEWSLARDTNSLGGEAGAEDRLVELHSVNQYRRNRTCNI